MKYSKREEEEEDIGSNYEKWKPPFILGSHCEHYEIPGVPSKRGSPTHLQKREIRTSQDTCRVY